MLGTETRLLFSNGVSNLAVHHTVASPDRCGSVLRFRSPLIRTVLLPSVTNGKTQVAGASVPLNDPAISHGINRHHGSGFVQIFFFIGVRTLVLLGGARASRPAFNKYFFIKRLRVFLYYAAPLLDNKLSPPKARLIESKSI